jgi:hypothetical protein
VTAVPNPRFRDQLAPLMPPHADWCHGETHGDCCGSECDCGVAESLDRIAAHVLAATNQRAAEERWRVMREAADVAAAFVAAPPLLVQCLVERELNYRRDAAALTQPAPTHTRQAEGDQPKERPPRCS